MAVDEQKLNQMFKTPSLSKTAQDKRGKIYRAAKAFARAVMKEGGDSDVVIAKIKEAVVLAVDASQRG